MVRSQRFHCQSWGSIRGWGIKILQATQCSKSLLVINAEECVEKREPSYMVGGNVNCIATRENNMDISQKTKNRPTII